MPTPCQKEEIIAIIKEDLKEIKKDIKSLLSFRWQIMGGASFIGFLLSFLISYFK